VLRWCPSNSNGARGDGTGSKKEGNDGITGNRDGEGGGGGIWPVAPYYDERFYGYGKNKIQYVSHLRLMGYRFAVLPRGFIVHNPHVDSNAKREWTDNAQDSDLHRRMDELYGQFLRELVDRYLRGGGEDGKEKAAAESIVQPCPEKG